MCPIMSAVAPQSCGVSALRSLAPCSSRWRPMCSGCLRGAPSWASASASLLARRPPRWWNSAARERRSAPPVVGFAAALLLGGALIQYAPLPLRLNFWALLAILAALFIAAWFLPRQTGSEAQGRWRPKTPVLPKHLRNVFVVAAAAGNSAYTHGVLILSLGSQVARDPVGSPNTLVNGAALSLFAIASALVGISARTLQPRTAMTGGAAASP